MRTRMTSHMPATLSLTIAPDGRGGRLMLFRVLQLVYFMAPAYLANMAPPFVRYWKGWNRPISRRWLGAHKTVLGFAAGVLAATLVTFVQWLSGWAGSIAGNEATAALAALLRTGGIACGSASRCFQRRLCG